MFYKIINIGYNFFKGSVDKMLDIYYSFLLFLIYSFLGYMVEVISVSFNQKKLVFSRGYLIGPYIPIFGVGSMIVTIFLSKYQEDIIAIFIMTMFFCSFLEYLTSYVLEKLFKLRWWDYSHILFNINGRICLIVGVLFGLGGILIIKVLNPLIFAFLGLFPKIVVIISAIVLFIIFLIDFFISTFAIIRLKIDTNKFINTDATRVIKEEVNKSLQKYRYFYNRLFKAFPEISKNKGVISLKEFLNKNRKNRNFR